MMMHMKGSTNSQSSVGTSVGDATHPVYIDSGGQAVAITTAVRNITISDQAPSGGSDGDIWIQY